MRKSKERLERVRAFTGESVKVSTSQDDDALFGIPLFILGDLYTTLVRVGQTVSLAVLQSTGIENNGRRVSAVSSAELGLEKSNIKLSGQILHLTEHTTSIQSGESSDPIVDESTCNVPSLQLVDTDVNASLALVNTRNGSVIWTGDYVKFNPVKAKKDKGNLSASQPSSNTVSRNALLFSVRSHVTERVSGTLVGTAALSEIESGGITSHGLNGTWEFDLTSLETMASTLWAKATTNSEKILELGMSFNNTFPYIVDQGVSLFPCYCYVINHHQCRSSNCCYRDGQRGPGAFENNMFYLRVPTSC